jgi:hypothetical protein
VKSKKFQIHKLMDKFLFHLANIPFIDKRTKQLIIKRLMKDDFIGNPHHVTKSMVGLD